MKNYCDSDEEKNNKKKVEFICKIFKKMLIQFQYIRIFWINFLIPFHRNKINVCLTEQLWLNYQRPFFQLVNNER